MFGQLEMLLGLVHGVDIRNYEASHRQEFAQLLADDLRFVAANRGHNRLILMGDFNMNPYESGMNLATGMNAMMTRACIASGRRTYLEKEYDFYYNPMWSLFGDGSAGPAGTVYNLSSQGPYGWSMLDQVLFNQSVVDRFERVEILTHAGKVGLTTSKGRPDVVNASDHLPILVKLKG